MDEEKKAVKPTTSKEEKSQELPKKIGATESEKKPTGTIKKEGSSPAAVKSVMPDRSVTRKEKVPKKARKLMKLGILVIVIVVVLAILGGGYWMVYQYSQDNAVKSALKSVVPFPVAIVNGNWISLEKFEENVEATNYFFDQQDELELGMVQRPEASAIRENEYNRLVSVAIMEQYAKEQAVTATDEDVDKYYNETILPQAPGGAEEVEQTIQQLYDWTIDEFKDRILYEVVLKTKLAEALTESEDFGAEEKAEADQLYQDIINSEEKPFSEFATEHSDDPGSGADGGMLGSFGKGVMVQEFEDAAFALEIGEVSEPVKTAFGYHIIKVTDKDEEAGTVEARHILIATKTIDEILAEKQEEASIRELMPQYAS
ncbi:peptidylprolyl isomerase [Patescibacteria group bacterium]